MLTAILTGVGIGAAALAAIFIPFIGTVLVLAARNLLAYVIVLPIKWGIEGIHRAIHRNNA